MDKSERYFITTTAVKEPRYCKVRPTVGRAGHEEAVKYQFDTMMKHNKWNEHYSMKWMVEFLQSQHYIEVKRCRYLKLLRELGVKQS